MNRGDRELMIERSMPVNARVDLVSLARIGMFLESLNSQMPGSMSQLVNWAVKMLDDIIGDKVPEIDSLSEALRWLEERGYKQATTTRRASMKMPYSLAAENLRRSGADPAIVDKYRHNTIYGKNKDVYVTDIPSGRENLLASPEEVRRKVEEVRKKNEEYRILKEKTLKAAKEQGLLVKGSVPVVKEKMTDKEFHQKMKEIEERDRERLAFENEALSPENLKKLAKRPSDDGE